MSLSGAKSHHFIMTAILVSALTLCWSAEAAPDAMRDVTLKKVRDRTGAWCLVGNPNVTRDMCVVFEYSNSAWSFFPGGPYARKIVGRLTGYETRPFAWAPLFQGPTLRCKVVYAWYGQPYKSFVGSCPYQQEF